MRPQDGGKSTTPTHTIRKVLTYKFRSGGEAVKSAAGRAGKDFPANNSRWVLLRLAANATIGKPSKQQAQNMTDPNEPLLTISQLAEKLQVTRETIRRMRKAGKLKEHRIGTLIRFRLSEAISPNEA